MALYSLVRKVLLQAHNHGKLTPLVYLTSSHYNTADYPTKESEIRMLRDSFFSSFVMLKKEWRESYRLTHTHAHYISMSGSGIPCLECIVYLTIISKSNQMSTIHKIEEEMLFMAFSWTLYSVTRYIYIFK